MTASGIPFAGIELGGTKCVCILGTGPAAVWAQESVSTSEPGATLALLGDILEGWRHRHGPFAALGIGSFGPIDTHRDSPRFGYVTSTPKPGWADTDLVGYFARRHGVPIGFATDVEGAALAEGRWGGARALRDFAYVTVGTGIGVGLIADGAPVGGFGHPELGHVRIARHDGDTWPGCCPFHGDCLEGLASGPALRARTGISPEQLPAEHPVWESVSYALGQLLHILTLATAPRRILIGGGVVCARPYLFKRIRSDLTRSLAGYRQFPELDDLDRYVCPPELGTQAGPLGALALAVNAAERARS